MIVAGIHLRLLCALEGQRRKTKTLRLRHNGILDLPKFLPLRQLLLLGRCVGIVTLHLALQHLPLFIAFGHRGQALHLVHHLVHQLFHPLGQIAILLLPLYTVQRLGKLPHPLFRLRVVTDALAHLLHQRQHGRPRLTHQFVPGDGFLFVQMEHLLVKNLIRQRGFDFANAVPVEPALLGLA